jgi:chaperone BCS1
MSSTAVEFGLINTFRTGHLVLDTLLCMLVPLAIQKVMALVQGREESLLHGVYRFFFPEPTKRVVTRVVETSQRFNKYGKIWDHEDKNTLLQKAISIYLADVLLLKNRSAQYELLEKPAKKSPAKSIDTDDVASSSSESTTGSDDDAYYGEVDKLTVEVLPPLNEWIVVEKDEVTGKPALMFMHEIATPGNADEGESGKKKAVTETKVLYKFQGYAPDGSKRIDAFIDRAFRSYQDAERKKHTQDKTRYFYIQNGDKSSTAAGATEGSTVAYKRYALGEEKTFDNLFFQDKRQVLQLLDSFTSKSGKFAIKGFPYKLGLLLHGPPGTGKTSLIKAIAQHTKRHIVTISLGKIKTNQELLDALFDMKFAVHGHDTPFELMFEDVVFVMEDIDCASSIVNARDDQESSKSTSRADKMVGSQKKAKKVDTTDDSDGLPDLMGPLLKPKTTDKLNLSGLLNVLDGVIDCPGRILIMTTNHPEKLDPALIRPGRVNKKLFLSHIQAPQAREMIEHYCAAPMSEEQVAVLDETFADMELRTTPAELEELCAEFDDAAAILEQLAKKNVDV